MATLFTDVTSLALRRIKDAELALFTDEELANQLETYLNSAILQFEYPKVDLFDRDEALKQFNQTLPFQVIQILAYLVAIEWFRTILFDVDLAFPNATPQEIRTFSTANQLSAIEKTLKYFEGVVAQMKRTYDRGTTGESTRYSELEGI